MLPRIIGWLTVYGIIAAAAAQPASVGPDEAPPDVGAWIEALESDNYSSRVRATEQLILAGPPSIPPVLQAIEANAGLETVSRGTYILRQLAMTGNAEAQDQAYRALQQIAERPFSGASRRAAMALQAVHDMRYRRAQIRLTQLGAVFVDANVQAPWGTRMPYPSIVFGNAWRGTPADFGEVRWITGFRPDESDDKWAISIEEQQVSDEWIDYLASLENVIAVKFKSSGLSDAAVTRLAELPDLEVLELLYTPVSDDVIPQLAALPRIARLRLIGTRITAAGAERLKTLAAHLDIDHRNGGFLGISCTDNPCRINHVQPNTAAAAAGFRVDDVITRYNGQPVETMEQLTRLISAHTAGDRVSIELMRDDERIVEEVELGAWD